MSRQADADYIKNLKPIIPIKDWPIYKLSQERESLLADLELQIVNALLEEWNGKSEEALSRVVYLEHIRLGRKAWKADRRDEPDFWREIKKSLRNAEGEQERREILQKIVRRYLREIVGIFKPKTYRFAQRAVPAFFNRILNATGERNLKRIFGGRKSLPDKIHIRGDIEKIRELAKSHTLVIVPTHFSNMDSLLVGWIINAIGLPAFTYGAGLNLFGIRMFAHFMNRLGAYKVDRRKKNEIYLQTLRSYSQEVLERDCHSLFFPGGTRSRSGALESSLKMGLLGTTLAAQYQLLQNQDHNLATNSAEYLDPQNQDFQEAQKDKANPESGEKKILILPAVINYHFVLEAASLIKDYLKGQSNHRELIENDAYSTSFNIGKFMLKFFAAKSEIFLSFGEPMDVFGQGVDGNGNSLGPHGQKVLLSSFFKLKGEMVYDAQREREYTRLLGEKILKQFRKYNLILSSHLVAYVAFKCFEELHPDLEHHALFRLPKDQLQLPMDFFKERAEGQRQKVIRQYKEGKTDVGPKVLESTDTMILYGIKQLGLYHNKRPLLIPKKNQQTILSQDLRVLYFYHNRFVEHE